MASTVDARRKSWFCAATAIFCCAHWYVLTVPQFAAPYKQAHSYICTLVFRAKAALPDLISWYFWFCACRNVMGTVLQLLGNVAVNALVPIFLEELVDPTASFIISTFVLVIVGEITPQAVCSRCVRASALWAYSCQLAVSLKSVVVAVCCPACFSRTDQICPRYWCVCHLDHAHFHCASVRVGETDRHGPGPRPWRGNGHDLQQESGTLAFLIGDTSSGTLCCLPAANATDLLVPRVMP